MTPTTVHLRRLTHVVQWGTFLCLTFLLSFVPPVKADVYVPPSMPARTNFLYGNSSRHALPSASAVTGTGYYYRVIKPRNYDSTIKYPVVFWLHWAGNGDNGSNTNEQNLTAAYNVNVPAIAATANPDNADNYPCFLVIPQGSKGSVSTQTWRADYNDGGTSTSGTPMKALENILATLNDFYSIDLDHVMLTGISAGGFGSYDLPCPASSINGGLNLFSSISPVSGGAASWSTFPAKLPLWVHHSANDDVLEVSGDDSTVKNMRQSGKQVIYSRYNTGGHGAGGWINAYTDPLFVPWLFAQQRGQEPQWGVVPQIENYSTAVSNTATIVGTAATDNDFSLVGWTTDKKGTDASGTDGSIDGTTAKMISNSTTFNSSEIGDRLSITIPITTSSPIKNSITYYKVTGVTTHSLTLEALYHDHGSGDSDIPKSPLSSGPDASGLTWALYPPSHILNPLSGTGGTGGTTLFTLSGINLTAGTANVLQSIGEAPAYTVNTFSSDGTNYGGYYQSGWHGGSGGIITVNNPTLVGTVGSGTAPAIHYGSTVTCPGNSATINVTNNHYVTDTIAEFNTLSISGTASASSGTLSSVKWESSIGYSGTATGTTSWSVGSIPLARGDNVLTFTATDTNGNVSTEMMDVTYAPDLTSNAGDYQEINWNYGTHSASVNLTGEVTTTLAGTPAYNWFQVSGPGTTTFGSYTSINTLATFSQPGTYVVRLKVTLGTEIARGDITVTVLPNGTFRKAIDCGGSGGTGVEGSYSADPGTAGGNNATAGYIVTQDRISPSADQTLHQTYRVGTGGADLNYTVSGTGITSGSYYDVILKFIEPNQAFAFAGLRTFDVTVQGTLAFNNLDLASYTVPFNAYDVVVPHVLATSSGISVSLTNQVSDPVISGIVVRSYLTP